MHCCRLNIPKVYIVLKRSLTLNNYSSKNSKYMVMQQFLCTMSVYFVFTLHLSFLCHMRSFYFLFNSCAPQLWTWTYSSLLILFTKLLAQHAWPPSLHYYPADCVTCTSFFFLSTSSWLRGVCASLNFSVCSLFAVTTALIATSTYVSARQ